MSLRGLSKGTLCGAAVAAAGPVIACAACNALLGNDDPTLRADAETEAGAGAEAGPEAASPPCDGAVLATDPANCGACGHGCLGGACQDGGCQPVLIAGDQQVPTGLAVDGDPAGWVYWTLYDVPGHVLRKRKAEASASIETVYAPAATSGETPMELALDATHVYWTSNDSYGTYGSIHWANQDGTDPHGFRFGGYGANIALDTAAIYWLERGPGQVLRLPFDGGPSDVQSLFLEPPDGGDRGGYDIAVEPGAAGRVFWTDSQTLAVIGKDGTGYEVLAGPNPQNAYAGPVALDADSLYFTGPTGRVLMKTDKSYRCPGFGQCPQVIVDSTYVASPGHLRLDGAHIFWGNNSDGRIVRAGLDGSAPTVLAQAVGGVDGFALDDQAIYFTVQYSSAGGRGSVWRLAR
jgi:hypothetical protein